MTTRKNHHFKHVTKTLRLIKSEKMCCGFGRPKDKDKSQKSKTMGPTKTTTKTITGNVTTAMPKEFTNAPEPEAIDEPKEAGKPLTKEVISVMKIFVDETCKKGIEGLQKEFEKLGPSKTHPHEAFSSNESKNRYSNIPCYDKTRIVLKYQVPPESDYIHANRVVSKIAALKSDFICTQGPTKSTTNDFWRMIWQVAPKFIVMLCKTHENNKPKCEQYWPLMQDESKTYGTIQVTNTGQDGKQSDSVFTVEKLTVRAEGKEIIVRHIRWNDWPDFGIPRSGLGMLRVLRRIEQDSGTAIVHCSAGIGRTGTLLAAEITMKALTSGKQVKIPEVLRELRDQRFGLVQTASQYIYLHISVCNYVNRKIEKEPDAKDTVARLKQFYAAYVDFAKNEEKQDKLIPDRLQTGK